MKENFWHHWRYKYRLSIMNEETFTETWHTRLSRMSVFVVLVLLFVVVLGLYSLLIFYTPLRSILPGYSESVRQSLIEESVRVDSLATSLDVQTRYLSVVRDIMAGEVKSDTVQSLDSMALVMRQELLEAKSQATADFIAQYESKEHDNLQLFDIQQTVPTITFFRPAHGVVITPFSMQQKQYGVELRVPRNENLTAVLDGAIIYVQYEIDNTYTIVLQHADYTSIYRHAGRVLKHVGDEVKSGESFALAAEEQTLQFELWQNSKPINPEEVIVF